MLFCLKGENMARRSKKNNNTVFLFCIFLFIVIVFIFLTKNDNISKDQYADKKLEYIETTKPLANKIAKKYKLFPSVILAQSALESNYGSSELSSTYNNYFGIKSNSKDGVRLDTIEYVNNKGGIYNENFRSYRSKIDSFVDYAKLITRAKRYEKVRQANDYKEACKSLQECGYATDPNYADKIISIIEKYKLYELDF